MAAQTYEGAFREAGTCLECALRQATRGDFCDYCAAGGKDEIEGGTEDNATAPGGKQ